MNWTLITLLFFLSEPHPHTMEVRKFMSQSECLAQAKEVSAAYRWQAGWHQHSFCVPTKAVTKRG